MSYNYYVPNPNSWRANASQREHGVESLPTQYPVFSKPSENGVQSGGRSLPYQHSSMPFTSTGYSQATYSDGPSQWFAEEAPDSTSVTMTSNVHTSPRVYQRGSVQAPATVEGHGVVQVVDDAAGYLPITRDSNLLPSSSSFLPTARDINSFPVDSGTYLANSVITYPLQAATYANMGNYSRRLDAIETQNLELGSQKKPESWLIAKFLDSVNSTENQPNACINPTADSAWHPQTISSNFLTSSQPLPTVKSYRYSKDTVVSAAVDSAKTTPRENSNYCWRTPPSNATMGNVSPKNGEKVVFSSKMKQEEKLPSKELGVDSGTLLAWTEYFRQLYLFNVINHQHDEVQAQNIPGFDGVTNLPLDPNKPAPKPGYSMNRRAEPLTNTPRGRHLQNPAATTSGSDELVVASAFLLPSKPSANGPMGEKQLGCRLCGLEDMQWNTEEFHKHVSSEEHRRQYQKQTLHLDSTNDHHHHLRPLQMRCKVCNLTIVESFSAHNRRTEHMEKKAMIQSGCLLCKVDSFQYFREYAIHMNGKQHKENQMKSHLQYESLTKRMDNSVNIVDSTQDKSANPDSSGSPDETTLRNKTNHMIKQTEKMIRTAFRSTAAQKPKIEIKLSPRQPLLSTDRTKAGLGRKIPEIGLARNKRTAEELEKSEVVVVESGSGEELQKKMKMGDKAKLSAGSHPIFPAAAITEEEKNRKQISQDNVQMVKNTIDADKQLGNSAKEATTAESESTLLECKNNTAMSSKGAESGFAPLPAIAETVIGCSSEESAEQSNKSTLSQQDEDIFVAVVGFYCKVCKTIYNKEEVNEDQHRQTATHLINLQTVVAPSFSAATGSLSSLPIPATAKQPEHKRQSEVNMGNDNNTEPTRVVDEARKEMKVLQKSQNTAKDHQHLPSQLASGIFGKHLVYMTGNFNSSDGPRPSDNLGKSNDLNEKSTEISSPRQLEEQGPKKLKTECSLAHQVQQQNNDHKQLEPSDMERIGNSTMKQGPRKRKLILAKSSVNLGNPKGTIHKKMEGTLILAKSSVNLGNPKGTIRKKMEGTLEESDPQEKNKDVQAEKQDAKKIIQTVNEGIQVRNKVSNKKTVIARPRNLSHKQLHTGCLNTCNSDTAAFVEVKQEPPETDSSLKVKQVKETNCLKSHLQQFEKKGENFKTKCPGMPTEHTSLKTEANKFPRISDILQRNDSANFSLNHSKVKKEVITTKENIVQGDITSKTSAPKSVNCHSTGPSSEKEIEKSNETIQMVGISTMPDMTINDSIIENSVAILAEKEPGNSGAAVIKTGKDLFLDFNADGKNKGNANKQHVGKTPDGKQPEIDKTLIVGKSGCSDKAVANDKNATNEKILSNSRTVTSDKNTTERTVTCDKANDRNVAHGNDRNVAHGNDRNVAHGNSGATEKSINDNTVTESKTVTDDESIDKTMHSNKTNASSGRATKDCTTRQTVVPADTDEKSVIGVVPADADEKSVIGKKYGNKSAVNNKTDKPTAEELDSSKAGNITAVTVDSAQSASNDGNADNVAHSKTPDNVESNTRGSTVKAYNNKSINTSLGSTSESCQVDSLSKYVDTKGVDDSAETPKPIDNSKNSDSSINTNNEVSSVVLPASLEKGCTIS